MTEKKRLMYVDFAKFIGIFLMVWCHAGMHNIVTSIIYAFHMPLFFFISGYLFNKNCIYQPTKEFVAKKAYSIIIPYVLFANILCFGTRGLADWVWLAYASRDSLAHVSAFTPLWFLPCFFCSTLIYYLICKMTERHTAVYYFSIVVVGALGFLLTIYRTHFLYGYPFNMDVALVGVLLMGMGNLIKSIRIKTVLGGVLLVIGVVLSLFNMPESLTEGNPHVEMSISSYGNPLLFSVNAFLLCTGILVLTRHIEIKGVFPKLIKLFSFYGANTITVLCLHGVVISVMQIILRQFSISNNACIAFITTVVCFMLLYPLIKIINSFVPNLVGKH